MSGEGARGESEEHEQQSTERPTLTELWVKLAELDATIAQHFKDLEKR